MRMMSQAKIKDVITMSNGFFAHIPYTFPEDMTKETLDIQFYANYGLRTVSPLIKLMQNGDSRLTNDALNAIGSAIWQTYHHKWDKQIAVYSIQYNPIYNYKDEYHEEHSESGEGSDTDTWSELGSNQRTNNLTDLHTAGITSTVTRTDNLSEQTTNNLTEQHSGNVTDSETRTDNLSQLETRNLSESQNDSGANNVFGYNSSTAVGDSTDSATSSKTDSGTVTTTNTGTQGTQGTTTDARKIDNTGTVTRANSGTQTNQTVNSGSDSTTHTGTVADSKSGSGTKSNAGEFETSGVKEYTHIGNIGNHPTQQLISDEIDLWRWNFVQEILDDVKEFTTIPIYID